MVDTDQSGHFLCEDGLKSVSFRGARRCVLFVEQGELCPDVGSLCVKLS